MPSSTRFSADVICPYYISDGKRTIICEGCMMAARALHEFPDAAMKDRWMQDVCADRRYGKLCAYANLMDYLSNDDR